MSKKKIVIFISIVVIALVSITVGGWLFLFYKSGGTISDITHNPGRIITFTQSLFYGPPTFNIVLLGRDYDYDNMGRRIDSGRTDTIIVFHVNCRDKRINGLSIPRDTLVNIPNYGETKINSAYHIGGIPLALETIENLLGVKIDYYVLLDPESFKRIIDAIGGVEIYVEKDMRYRDSWAKLNIDLKKGYQRLNGSQAEGYIRFRHDPMGDIGRIERQQKFFHALLSQVIKPEVIIKIPRLVGEVSKYVHTNLPSSEIISLASIFAREKDKFQVKTAILPGSVGRGGYWITNKEEMERLVSLLFTDADYTSDNTAQAKVIMP